MQFKRNQEIYDRINRGEHIIDLGREYGLSRQRILEIYKNHTLLTTDLYRLFKKHTDDDRLASMAINRMNRLFGISTIKELKERHPSIEKLVSTKSIGFKIAEVLVKAYVELGL